MEMSPHKRERKRRFRQYGRRSKGKYTRYYINRKQDIPEKSTLLCATDGNDLFLKAVWSSEKLYQTSKGTFFSVGSHVHDTKKKSRYMGLS